MRFTIFGSSGFIGSHLKDYLERIEGAEVICPTREEVLANRGDLGCVFYCIGMTGDFQKFPMPTVEAHVTLLKNILTRTKFEHFVYLSSTRIYGQSPSTSEEDSLTVRPTVLSDIYNISKIMGESICLHVGQPNVKVVRLSNVFDYRFLNPVFTTYLYEKARSGEPLTLLSQLGSAKDYITIDNVVELLYKISLHGTQAIYNVANGVNVTHDVLLKLLRERFPSLQVSVAQESPLVVNPSIDVARIATEFSFHPKPFERAFAQALN